MFYFYGTENLKISKTGITSQNFFFFSNPLYGLKEKKIISRSLVALGH